MDLNEIFRNYVALQSEKLDRLSNYNNFTYHKAISLTLNLNSLLGIQFFKNIEKFTFTAQNNFFPILFAKSNAQVMHFFCWNPLSSRL